jgi:hypothetical protein
MRSIPALVLALLVTLLGANAFQDTLAQDAPPVAAPGELIELVASAELDVTIPQGDDPATTDVTIRNLTATDQVFAFCFLEASPAATCAESPVTIAIDGDGILAPLSVATIRLTITETGDATDRSGFLVATIDGQAQVVRPMTMTHETFAVAAWNILAAALLVALVFTFARKISMHGSRKRPLVDNPSLKGWATAVTVATGVGAPLLTGFLGGESTLLPGREFAILGILFALMIFIAPLIYGLNRKPADSNTLVAGESATTPPIMGIWRLFWVSIALSVWAFTGTALTVGLFIADAWDAGTLSFPNTLILAGACLAMFAILALHSWRQIDHITTEEPLSTTQLVLSGVTDIQSIRVIVQPHIRHRFSGL